MLLKHFCRSWPYSFSELQNCIWDRCTSYKKKSAFQPPPMPHTVTKRLVRKGLTTSQANVYLIKFSSKYDYTWTSIVYKNGVKAISLCLVILKISFVTMTDPWQIQPRLTLEKINPRHSIRNSGHNRGKT